MEAPVFVAAVLCACIIISELLVRHTPSRHAGTAMVVIVVAAVASNIGLIPSRTTPLYEGIFTWLAPLAIFWLLLRVDLRRVLQAGLPLLGLFLIGAAGTVVGVLVGMKVIGAGTLGPRTQAVAGMFAATYVGGSANFNALALHYEIMSDAPLYAGAMAVDAGLTAIWMAATLALPRVLGRPSLAAAMPTTEPTRHVATPEPTPPENDEETITPLDLGILLALGLAALWASNLAAAELQARGVPVPSILILTTLALAIAQTGRGARLRGTSLLGMFAVYVFLAVIGSLCDVRVLAQLGDLGLRLGVLASICILVHGAVTFAAARLMRLSPDLAAVASQANIGGGTTALALARSLGRQDLVLPAILVGSLGTALGTFLGFWVAEG